MFLPVRLLGDTVKDCSYTPVLASKYQRHITFYLEQEGI